MKKVKRFFSLLLVFTCLVSLFPKITSFASGSGYISPTVTYRIVNDTLYIEGTGEVPDYIGVDYINRPWNNLSYSKVSIAAGITRIGQYAFANNGDLKNIEMYSTTFLTNNTCFGYTSQDVIIRIHGSEPAYEQLGAVSYSSWESIAAGAPDGFTSIFVLDNSTVAAHFRSIRYPYLNYVYSPDMGNINWANREKLFGEDAFSNVCHIATADGSGLSAAKEPFSESYMENVGPYIKLLGCNYLASYRLLYYESGKLITGTISKNKNFVLNLDSGWQVSGVNFYLIEFCDDGSFYVYSDLDSSIKTFTFQSTNVTGRYVLVYK